MNSSDVALAQRLADAAGNAIRPLFRGDWKEETKADFSAVTEADRAAEAAMRAILETEMPDDGVIGEEYGTRNEGAGRGVGGWIARSETTGAGRPGSRR